MAQIDERETTDEILEETRRIKLCLAEAMNFDIDRILAEAKAKQEHTGRTVLPPPARKKS